MWLFFCEAHDDEREGSKPVESPLSKAEVVNERVDVCWNDVADTQNCLKLDIRTKHKQTHLYLLYLYMYIYILYMRLGVVQAQWFRTMDLKVVSHYN